MWSHFDLAFCPKFTHKFRTEVLVSDTADRISTMIDAEGPGYVWVPADFASLGTRAAIDKTLQRMVARGTLRRIDRGLYDRPALNRLTKRAASPDYRAVIDALARRDQNRILIDGMTAANDLGLTDAVPARVTIYTDTQPRSIHLDKLTIDFKPTAEPASIGRADRPCGSYRLSTGSRTLPGDGDRIRNTLARLLCDPKHGDGIQKDLTQGFGVLPAWMQSFLGPYRVSTRCLPPVLSIQQSAPHAARPRLPGRLGAAMNGAYDDIIGSSDADRVDSSQKPQRVLALRYRTSRRISGDAGRSTLVQRP